MSSAEQKRKPGRPKGSFRGHGWSQRRQIAAPIVTAAAPAVAEIIQTPEPRVQTHLDEPAMLEQGHEKVPEPGVISRLRLIARVLWIGCYRALFAAELAENEAACVSEVQLPPTSYRARLKGERAELYDHRRRVQRRDELAIRLHANNERHWSPSLLARSVTYFLNTTAWQREVEGRCVAHGWVGEWGLVFAACCF